MGSVFAAAHIMLLLLLVLLLILEFPLSGHHEYPPVDR